jgi:multiple sugar transport system permease protein
MNNYDKKNIPVTIILSIFAVIFILPLLYALYTSFLKLSDIDKLVGIQNWTLESYLKFWKDPNYDIPRWFLNTVIMTLITVAGNVIINSMAGYALAKLKFPGKTLVFFIIVATMTIPYQVVLIPVYVTMAKLNWLNTMASLTVPYLYQCLFVFMMKQFFQSIPNELLEAARIDGLSKVGTFSRIMLPLSKPGIISMVILNFTSTWNAYLVPSTMSSNSKSYVLIVGLNSVKDQFFDRTNVIMAGVILITLPVILLFLIFQKQYIEGVATSGLKG